MHESSKPIKQHPPEMLETERLILRRPAQQDAPAIFSYAGDEQTTLFMSWPRHKSIADSLAFISMADEGWNTAGDFPVLLEHRADRQVIGSSGFRIEGDSAFIGYILRKEYWGQGLALEAASKMIHWLKNYSGLNRITSCVHHSHAASARILEKAGLKEAGSCLKLFPNYSADMQKTKEFSLQI